MRLNEIEGVGKEAKNVMWWNEKRKSRPPTRVVVIVSHLPHGRGLFSVYVVYGELYFFSWMT